MRRSCCPGMNKQNRRRIARWAFGLSRGFWADCRQLGNCSQTGRGERPYPREFRGDSLRHAECLRVEDDHARQLMDYDLGYFDLETRVLEPLENPFGPRLSPM